MKALACEGGAFASPHVQTLLRAAEGELVAEGLATLADVSSELERGRRVVTGELFYPALVASLGVLFMAGVLAFCAEVLPDSAYEMWRFKVTWVLELMQLTRALPWLPWLVEKVQSQPPGCPQRRPGRRPLEGTARRPQRTRGTCRCRTR